MVTCYAMGTCLSGCWWKWSPTLWYIKIQEERNAKGSDCLSGQLWVRFNEQVVAENLLVLEKLRGTLILSIMAKDGCVAAGLGLINGN